MPFKNKAIIDYSNTSNSNFLRFYFLLYPESDEAEDGSSVAELGGVKSCIIIAIIYDLGVSRKWKRDCVERIPSGNSLHTTLRLRCSSAHIGRSENGKPLQSSLTSVYEGQALPNNEGRNLPPNEDYPLPEGLKMPSHIGSYKGKGDPDNFLHLFKGAIRIQKWLMPVACHMFTYTLKDSARIWWNSQKADLPPTYKGLMEKMYTWVEAREVATNGVLSDRRDSFKRLKKSSWDNNRGQKNKDSPDPRSHKFRATFASGERHKERKGRVKKDKSIVPVEAPILMISREDYTAKNTVSESMAYKEEIRFPPVMRVSNAQVIIEVAIFRRKVG
ncbi:hypothetical protein Tco_0712900 [Tanacetum coccineum]